MEWKNTKALRMAAENVYSDLSSGKIDMEQAKALGAQIRTAAKIITIELEVARMGGGKIDGGLKSVELEAE